MASNKNTATIDGHKDRVETVAFSPNGNILVSGGSDTAIKLWDVATAENIITLSENVAVVTSVAFSPDGKTVAAGGYRQRGQAVGRGHRQRNRRFQRAY